MLLVYLMERTRKNFTSRTVNPALYPLSDDPNQLVRFTEIVNGIVEPRGSGPVSIPHLETAEFKNDEPQNFKVVKIPYAGCYPSQEHSLRNLSLSLYQIPSEIREGLYFDLPPDEYGAFSLMKYCLLSPALCYFMVATFDESYRRANPYRVEGYFFVGSKERPLVGALGVEIKKRLSKKPTSGVLELHDFGTLSEAEFAYQVALTSLIMDGVMDISDGAKMVETLPERQDIFLQISKQMTLEIVPGIRKEDIFGLESQIKDIQTNLFGPLEQGKGQPMSTLLVGAPGVGKSFIGRYFMANSDVMTLPLPVSLLNTEDRWGRKILESQVIPRLVRIRNNLRIPIVLWFDDIEAILEEDITVKGDVKASSVNAEKRSRALSLLERLSDTYGFYVLGTLNHPDIEAAFLRRFNPVCFPLPNMEQRAYMIREIIQQGQLKDADYQDLIERLVERTDGFNYSGLTIVPDYLANLLHRAGLEDVRKAEPEVYRRLLDQALEKAAQRTDLVGLKVFDKAAREMVATHTNGRLGFSLPN